MFWQAPAIGALRPHTGFTITKSEVSTIGESLGTVRLDGPIGSAIRLGIAVVCRRENENGAVVSPMRKSTAANSRDVGVRAVRGSNSGFIFVNFDPRTIVVVDRICQCDEQIIRGNHRKIGIKKPHERSAQKNSFAGNAWFDAGYVDWNIGAL